MKRFFALFFVAAFMFSISAQPECDITLGVYNGEENSEMTPQNIEYLKTVINRAITEGSGAASIDDNQFGLFVKSNIIDKHVISGSPAKTVLNIELTLLVGNVMDGKLVSSWSIELDGVGNSTGKAFNNAIHKLKPQNKELVKFVDSSKKKIVKYYDQNYNSIIRAAESKAQVYNYEEAIYDLMCVPECCVGYDIVMAKTRNIFKQYVNRICQENLSMAQSIWMSGYSYDNAEAAAVYLSKIYPDAECYGEAVKLMNEIKKHMGERWKFEMKQWDDKVSVEKQQLANAKEVALAYAKNQPKQVIHIPSL